MIVLGIDPGASGGLTYMGTGSGGQYVHGCVKMPSTERAVWDVIEGWGEFVDLAFIEHVHSFPGQGVVSTFKFGQNYGMLRMALIASKTPFEKVSPTTWQKVFGLIKKKGETKTEKKRRHLACAQEMFPDLDPTLATCDAILIAKYGYMRTG